MCAQLSVITATFGEFNSDVKGKAWHIAGGQDGGQASPRVIPALPNHNAASCFQATADDYRRCLV